MLPGSRYLLIVGVGLLCACTGCESQVFRDQVDEATQEKVAGSLGAPHTVDTLPDGRSVWTYFERGSSTSGYGGFMGASPCTAYVLTFDQDGVLREWKQEDCTTASLTTTGPFADHK